MNNKLIEFHTFTRNKKSKKLSSKKRKKQKQNVINLI